MNAALQIRVEGEVQGVFFRAHAKAQADWLGLKGWVRNEADGTVLIEAEGEREQLDRLVEWCKGGSPEARVTKVEVEEAQPEHHTQFRVM